MIDHVYAALCERIWQKCQRDGWYGGSLDSPTWLHVRVDHLQRMSFAYPPASEEQLLATEAALDFPLLPLLWALYAEIANDGFGLGAGIQGALGRYDSFIDEPGSTLMDDYRFQPQVGYANMGGRQPVQLVDLVNYAGQWKRGKAKEELLLPPYEVWSEQFLLLEDLGCCQQACLDCKNGRVLCTVPTANDEEYDTDSCDGYYICAVSCGIKPLLSSQKWQRMTERHFLPLLEDKRETMLSCISQSLKSLLKLLPLGPLL
jgi:hypothetical protein